MGSLVFSCPESDNVAIQSGIEADLETLSAIQSENVVVNCPRCCRTHRLSMRDARLSEEACS